MPDAAGPEIVIAGTREDWPGGAQTLTPRDPCRKPNRRIICSGPSSTRPGARCGSGSRRRPSAGCGRRRPAPAAPASSTPPRLADAGPSAAARTQPASRCGSRMPEATRGSNVCCGGEDGFPHPDPTRRVRARAPDGRPPAASPRPPSPRTPAGRTPGRSAASTPGSASELTSRGASTTDVMLAGNWKTSRMVAHYSAGATSERGAVARYL